jgi:hypothetical protein
VEKVSIGKSIVDYRGHDMLIYSSVIDTSMAYEKAAVEESSCIRISAENLVRMEVFVIDKLLDVEPVPIHRTCLQCVILFVR